MKFQKGFTLVELMIAAAIVAILAMIAIPSYSNYIARSARASVESDLMQAAATMERRKAQNFSYIGSVAGTSFPNRSPNDAPAGRQKYNISLTMWNSDNTVSTATTDPTVRYELLAVSTNNFPGAQEALKINELGQKCYKANANTCTIGTDQPNWP